MSIKSSLLIGLAKLAPVIALQFCCLGSRVIVSDLFPTDLTSPAPYTSPVRNLGVIFEKNLIFADHITKLSQICYMHIRDLRRLRPILDYKTASTIATSIVHSKLDYCNSLFYSINSS